MLSIFPNLLSYPLLAYAILRLVLAFQFAQIALDRRKKPVGYLTIPEGIVSVFVLIGLWTQIASLVLIILIFVEIYLDQKFKTENSRSRNIFWLLGSIAFALLFLGPGIFAFDLPL